MDYYLQLTSALEQSGRNYDVDVIKKAYDFANERHAGQLRRSGEPYILHPVAVAELLIGLGLDNACVCAALLHDVVEDTRTTIGEVKALFGEETAELVDGVTKLTRLPTSSVEEEQAENLRKMLLAMSKDIRVMIIKLCDRLHNMRTLEYLPDQKQRDKARETMEIYAPIAHRLGMSSFKEELEDLALKYLDPHAYDEILRTLEELDEKNGEFTREITAELKEKLALSGIDRAEIQSRKKSVYGIYRKLFIQGRSMEEIYDIYAIRILVDTVAECYNALGVVHDLYTPIPKRFKDYISTPKQNMYRSLHTTVIARNHTPFEIQIRTFEMHHDAEYGVAAHWKYKAGLSGRDTMDDKLEWVRQLLESQRDSDDSMDILRSIKSDLLPEEVFVFTPKGDVIDLPAGATVIDFAYAIHSAVGNRMVGAKVNGRIVPITYKVNSSEVIEIITGPKDKGPSRDWLNIVQTSEARGKIRAWFKKERREENTAEGKAMFEKELRKELIHIPEDRYADFLDELVRRQKLNTPEEMYAEIGYGGLPMSRLMPKIREQYDRLRKQLEAEDLEKQPEIKPADVKITRSKSVDGVIIEGLDSCLVKFSKCCNPLPGDEIVGFVTRGHGVSIHKKDCRSVAAAMETEEGRNRIVKAAWDSAVKEQFHATISVMCQDRTGLIADLSGRLSASRIPIFDMNTAALQDGRYLITLSIGVNGSEHLKSVIQKLEKVKGVVEIRRQDRS